MAKCKKSKRKANGEGYIRQRSDGRWEAQVSMDGKRKSLYGGTQLEVRKKLTALQAENDMGYYSPTTDMTVEKWLEMWSQDYWCGLADSTRKRYREAIERHIVPQIGGIMLSQLTVPAVQHMCNVCSRKGLSPKTVRMVHGTLHAALEKAVKLQIIRNNVADCCDLPRIAMTEMNPLKDDSLMVFLNTIRGDMFEQLFYVDVFTGLRLGEIMGLSWDCVDFKAGTIRVYRQLQKGREKGQGFHFTQTKNSKGRIIQPAVQVMEVLHQVRTKQMEWKLRAGATWNNRNNLVFTNETGGNLSDVSIRKHFKNIVRAMQRPEVRFHDLRHTFATLSIQNGTDIKTVSQELGHATVAFTLDRYGHVSDAMRKNASNRMTQLINSL